MGWTDSHILLYKFFVMFDFSGLYMTLCIIHNILTGDTYTNLGGGCEYENMRVESNHRKIAANDLRDNY